MSYFERLPLTALRAFEAAARLGSFKSAAAELAVTPTAVSHQIRQLEDDLSHPLFTRHTRKVVLTDAGERLAQVVSQAFGSVATELETFKSGKRQRIDLALGPIIASRWLTPRLSAFWRDHPAIDLRLHHSPLVVDPDNDVDLAIAWGTGPWPGFQVDPLLTIHVTPVVSPQLLDARGPLATTEDLANFPVIHQRDGHDWAAWLEDETFAGLGIEDAMTIEDANVALQAAISGQGVALGILEFIEDDLTTGRLVAPLNRSVVLSRAYHLLVRRKSLKTPHIAAVHTWLKDAAAV